MEPDRRTTLEAFVEAYAQTLGGLAERDAQGDLVILDPVSGKLRLLVFEPEGLAERPEAELVAPGSVALEELLGHARQRGRVSRVRLEVPPVPDRTVAASVIRALQIPEADIQIERLHWLEAEYAAFLFRAAFVCDVREEELLEIVLDRSTGRLVRRWDELRAAGSLHEGPPHESVLAGQPLRAAYELARAEVLRKLSAQVTQHQRSLSQWRQREALRLRRYHQELSDELTQRAQKEHDEARRAALLGRIEANQLEESRWVRELDTKYALSVELECASLLLVGVPKALVTCSVKDPKRLRQAQLEPMWNLAARAVEPLDCPRCGQPGFAFAWSHTGLACNRCTVGP